MMAEQGAALQLLNQELVKRKFLDTLTFTHHHYSQFILLIDPFESTWIDYSWKQFRVNFTYVLKVSCFSSTKPSHSNDCACADSLCLRWFFLLNLMISHHSALIFWPKIKELSWNEILYLYNTAVNTAKWIESILFLELRSNEGCYFNLNSGTCEQ